MSLFVLDYGRTLVHSLFARNISQSGLADFLNEDTQFTVRKFSKINGLTNSQTCIQSYAFS